MQDFIADSTKIIVFQMKFWNFELTVELLVS